MLALRNESGKAIAKDLAVKIIRYFILVIPNDQPVVSSPRRRCAKVILSLVRPKNSVAYQSAPVTT